MSKVITQAPQTGEVVISVKDLKISFYTDHGRVKAVRGINFELHKGEILCIVGESGSGKSVTAKTIMGILPGNGRIDGGSIMYEGEDLTQVSEEEFHRIRGKKIGMVFQDPLSSLNPIMKVGKQITEAIVLNGNKLKKYYDDLISKEFIAYKNALSKKKRLHELARLDYESAKKMRDNKIEKAKLSSSLTHEERKESILAAKAEFKPAKEIRANAIKAANEEMDPIIKGLKAELGVVIKSAKAQTRERKRELKKVRKQNIAKLTAELKNTLDINRQKEIKTAIKTEKVNYTNTIRVTRKAAKERAIQVMKEVGIPNAERRYNQYPFEFSGGMRQRVVIAIALTQDPDILILDEPTTALDVTIQAQILELLNKLKRERQLSCIFITHDLGVVANMADRVAVMYAGRIVEQATVNELFYNPQHPYTWALLSSIADVDSEERLEAIPGTPPDMVNPPKGDAFSPRNRYALAIDFEKEPPMYQVSPTHFAATWLLDPRAPKVKRPAIVEERIRNSLAAAKKAGVKIDE